MSMGSVSDGYHTFDELYEHRHALFLNLLKSNSSAWKSRAHADGSVWEGWFIAGISEPMQITYHLPERLWDKFDVKELTQSPVWDGHTSADVVDRLYAIAGMNGVRS